MPAGFLSLEPIPVTKSLAIVIGILSFEEYAENLCAYYHRGARQETVPGMKPEANIDPNALLFEMWVVMDKKFGQQAKDQYCNLYCP